MVLVRAPLRLGRPDRERHAVHHHQATDAPIRIDPGKGLPHRLSDLLVIVLPRTPFLPGNANPDQMIQGDTALPHVVLGQFQAVAGPDIGIHQYFFGLERPANAWMQHKLNQIEAYLDWIVTGARVHDALPFALVLFMHFIHDRGRAR